MKRQYKIIRIDHDKPKTVDDYNNCLNNAKPIYKNSFSEVVELLGGKPFRQRAGWTALKGNVEYIITREG